MIILIQIFYLHSGFRECQISEKKISQISIIFVTFMQNSVILCMIWLRKIQNWCDFVFFWISCYNVCDYLLLFIFLLNKFSSYYYYFLSMFYSILLTFNECLLWLVNSLWARQKRAVHILTFSVQFSMVKFKHIKFQMIDLWIRKRFPGFQICCWMKIK